MFRILKMEIISKPFKKTLGIAQVILNLRVSIFRKCLEIKG
jgi:hypothetical protein